MSKEAKDFILAQVAKGLLTKEELTAPNSAFNRIKNLLEPSNSSGYMGYFVRQYYGNKVGMDKLTKLLEYLVNMKRLNKAVDLSKYSKVTVDELMRELKSIVDVKAGTEMPGIIINESDETEIIAAKIKQFPWYVVLCVKKDAHGNWMPDRQTLLNWGSPKWCIKREEYWSQNHNYIKSKDHLQYVVIHKDFYNVVIEAAKAKTGAKIKLVPVNYGTNYDDADRYSATSWKIDSTKLRYGITTNPTEGMNFFNQKEHLTCFDDSNSNVPTIERFTEQTNGLPIRLIDIEIRKILGLKRSEFDVTIPSFEEIINFIDFKPTKKPEDLIKLCGQFVQVMSKAQSKTDEYPNLQKEICPYLISKLNTRDAKNIFFAMTYIILYADKIDQRLIDVLEELYQINNIEDDRLNMTVAISMLQIYMTLKEGNMIVDKNADLIIDKLMVKNFLLHHTLKASINDKPTSTIDFKRAMLQTFRRGELHQNLENVNANVTRAKLFQLLSNYLYLYDKEYGERVLNGEFFKPGKISWNDEVRFLEEMEKKIKTNDTSRNEFIDTIAYKMLKNMPDALSDRIDGQKFDANMEDVFLELETHEYEYEYRVSNHAENMFSALKYYTQKVNPDIKKELLKEN